LRRDANTAALININVPLYYIVFAQFIMYFKLCILLFTCGFVLHETSAQTIYPGVPWFDIDGNRIEAHGMGLLIDNGVYYWYGESKKTDSLADHGINCYSTTDKTLTKWKFEGSMLAQKDIVGVPFSGPFVIERPKVMKNPYTNLYVMYIHLDDANYTSPNVGVATANSPLGPFKFVHAYKPDGIGSYDMTVYQDDDGRAYLIRSVVNQFVGISLLSDDYLTSKQLVSYIGEAREGQAMFKYKGNYYLWTSHLSGWYPNAAELFVADGPAIIGAEWISLGNPSGSGTTFDSQSAYVLPYQLNDGSVLPIYMGDRWNYAGPGGLLNATYIWLPVSVTADGSVPGGYQFKMPYNNKWSISQF
jgi:hypothetical protein